MADIEKVIKGLEELEGFLFKEYTNIKAEESKIYYDRFKSLSDAIAMLKEYQKTRLEIAHEMVSGSILMYQGKELVQCKDCKHYTPNRLFECDKHGACSPNPEWFCADGERRDDDA